MRKTILLSSVILFVVLLVVYFMQPAKNLQKKNTVYKTGKTETKLVRIEKEITIKQKAKITKVKKGKDTLTIAKVKPTIYLSDSSKVEVDIEYNFSDSTYQVKAESILYEKEMLRVDTLQTNVTITEEKTNWTYVIIGTLFGVIMGIVLCK